MSLLDNQSFTSVPRIALCLARITTQNYRSIKKLKTFDEKTQNINFVIFEISVILSNFSQERIYFFYFHWYLSNWIINKTVCLLRHSHRKSLIRINLYTWDLYWLTIVRPIIIIWFSLISSFQPKWILKMRVFSIARVRIPPMLW
jgi:hypothetical protein